mmetsp:Transcript_66229/g.103424  ORF Transcript_66229/g.103424 Transcript_66229/m.103424 type:complete len:1122 (+) Transcript_66229:64-3429(+)
MSSEGSPAPGRVSVLEGRVRQLEKGLSSSTPSLRQQDLMQGSNLSKIMRDMEESGWLTEKNAQKDSVSPSTPQTMPWRTSTPGSSGTTPMTDLGLGSTLSSIQAKAEALAATRAALLPTSSSSTATTTRFPGFGTPPVAVGNDTEGSGQPAEKSGSTSPAPPVSPGLGNVGMRTPLRGGEASSSTSLARVGDVSSASPNSTSLLSLIRRELEHVETRLKAQVSQVKEGLSSTIQKTDKLREVAINRLDQKVATVEVAQSKLDRKVSELSGTLRGLSDEAQAQIRRADTVDSRLWEFRHGLEEEFRQKLADVGLQLQEMSSNCRIALSASEDVQKRLSGQLKRMEASVQDAADLERNQVFLGLKARLESIELGYTREAENTKAACEEIAAAAANKSPIANLEATESRLWQTEQQVCDLMQKVERLVIEAHGDRGWDARFQEHEVRLQGIRSKLDSQEVHLTGADDRFRQDCEQRFDQARRSLQDVTSKQLESQERLESLARSSQVTESAITELAVRLQSLAGDVSKHSGALQATEQTVSPQAHQIETLSDNLHSLFTEVRGKEEVISTLRNRVRELDAFTASRDQKDRETSMDILRRITKLEGEVSAISNQPPVSPHAMEAQAASERTLQSLTDRTKETERNWIGHMQEMRQDLSGIVDQIRKQDEVTQRLTESASSATQAVEDMMLRLERVEVQSGSMVSTVAQVNGSYALDPHSQEGIKEMRNQIKDLMLRMPSAERLSKHFSELKTLAEKLTEVQQDTARQLVYAEANSPSQSNFPGNADKMTPDVGGEGSPPVKELATRMAANEVAVQFVRSQVAEMWDQLVTLRGKVSPRGDVAFKVRAMPQMVEDEASDLAADVVTQELGGLFQRVEEGEMECAKLQEQLKGRIATMDQLLDKVAREVLGPEGADIAAAVALNVAAVEEISQKIPKGLRICILGSFSGDTPFNRPSSRLLVEAIARQVSEKLADDVVVLTCGMPGVQESFVRSLSSRVKVVNLVSEDGCYSYAVGTDVHAGSTLEDRMVLLGQLGHVYLTVEGSPIVAKEAKAAFARGAVVIPLICTGDASAGAHDFPVAALRKLPFATDDQWLSLSLENHPELTAGAVIELLKATMSHMGNNGAM